MTEDTRTHSELDSIPVSRGGTEEERARSCQSWEKELLALAGLEEEAFTRLVKELHGPLLQTALSYLRNRDAAEEVVQETWMAAIRGVSGFEGRSSLRSWIFAILHNCTKQRIKREQRRRDLLQAAVGDGRVASDRVTTAVSEHGSPTTHKTPERLFLSGESGEALRHALSTLPAKQQAIIRLRDVEGYTSQEVCSYLGLTRGAERALLFRARSRLRHLLAPYLRESM